VSAHLLLRRTSLRQYFSQGIDRGICREAMTCGHLSQKFTTGGEKNDRNTGLPAHMLQVAEIFRTLKQPGARLARRLGQQEHNRLFLRADGLEQTLFLVCRLNEQQAKISIFVQFHRDLVFSPLSLHLFLYRQTIEHFQ
jgi:hypothetical protein